MKNILFFITAIIFITGCGSSFAPSTTSSTLPVLSPEQAIKSNILIFRNMNSAKLAMTQKELKEDFNNDNAPAKEFLYSSNTTCESLGFSENNSHEPMADNEPNEKFYFVTGSSADCLEIDYAKTGDTGDKGLIVVLPSIGGPKDISIN